MKTYFDEDGRPIAVDETHPVDILEPEEEAPVRSTPDAILMIDRIGGSFLRGNPFIIQVAWSFLLNQQTRSMEYWARKLGCTRQAISKQVTRLANRFGYPISNRLGLEMRRRVGKKSRAARKRRGHRNPPAATNGQSKTNDRAAPDRDRP